MEFIFPLLLGFSVGAAVFLCAGRATDALWSKMLANPRVNKAFDFVFVALALVAFLVHAILSIGRFEAFGVYGIDFALFAQVIWNTQHGHLLVNTVVQDAPILLAQRFSPILFAFVPIYVLFGTPYVLVLVPALAVTLAAFPLYWFARRRVGHSSALVISFAFLTAPGLQAVALDQFKEIMLAIPFLMLAVTFLVERKYLPFLASLVLAMMCKEEIGFIAAAFGVYIFFAHRRYVFGGVLAIFGMTWVLFLILVVIPRFQGGSTYYYFGGSEYFGSSLYSYLGSSPSEIIVTALTRPDIVLPNVFTAEKIDAVMRIVLPLGIVALFGLDVFMLALPTFGYTLLSNRRMQFLFGSYHYSPVYVFLFIGLVLGLERLAKWLQSRSNIMAARRTAVHAAFGAFILISSVSSYWFNASGPMARNFDLNSYLPTAHDKLGGELARMIPPEATVLAQTELTSHVAERRYLFVDVAYSCLTAIDIVFADMQRPWYKYREDNWREVLASGWFEPVIEKDGYILRRRSALLKLENELDVQFGDDLSLVGYNIPLTEKVTGGQWLRVLTGWKTKRQLTERYVFELGLYDSQGHLWAQTAQEPCQGIRPTDRWLSGLVHYDDSVLKLPPTMPSGNYRIVLSVHSKGHDDAVLARDSQGASLGTEIDIKSISVVKNTKSFTASEIWIEQRYYVDMGEMRLLGFKPLPESARVDQVLPLGLYWRARNKPQSDYVVVVQLRDESGRTVVEHAARPANGTYPTTEWNTGEVLLDWHDVMLPKDMKAGTFQVVVSMKDALSTRVLGEAAIAKIQVLQ